MKHNVLTPTPKAVNIFSAVAPVEHGMAIADIAKMLQQKTADTLKRAAADSNGGHVIVRGDDGRVYVFDVQVVPVKLDKAEEMKAILAACPYVFIGQTTGVTEESLLDFNAPAKYVKIFKVCVAKNAEDAQDGKYTVITERFVKHYAIKFANENLGTTFDKFYTCRPL
jgi:hypothetical protein